jgi:hypothetical protein
MRHGTRSPKTLKFALPSAVEILLRFQSLEGGSSRKWMIDLPEKRWAGAGRPIFMKFV